MKLGKYAVVVTAFALIAFSSAFARDNNEIKIVLDQPTMVGSTQLQPGTYEVQWNGSRPETSVNFVQNKKVVATVQGELKPNDTTSREDAIVLKHASENGSQVTLTEVDLGKQRQALMITSNNSNPPDQTQTR